ncbi:MAG: hypothetical protein FD174_1709 [Geobacteraceae bacterium]|nr:MAG: hypothetical protein FD174_1709 [Geobacteraceae bacterium]
MKQLLCLLSMAVFCSFSVSAFGQDTAERHNSLETAIKSQSKTIEEQQKTIEGLKDEIEKQKNQEPQQKEAESPLSSKVSGFFGGNVLTNPNISLLLDTFVYRSNLSDSELANRGIPGFTTLGKDARNGFNMGAAEDGAELFIFAPVDPYFNLYANIPFSDEGVVLEEIFAVTTALPEGFQAKVGKFKSNFSRLDAQHPHQWDFFDIALPYRAFVGGEGLGGEKGVQLTWLPALPFYTQFGAEVLQGENDLLFGADARSGPHAFSIFVKSSFETTENSTLYFGPSVLFGKTKTGSIVADSEFRGNSALYGMEAVWKWKPARKRGLTLQGEYLYLAQQGDLEDPVAATVDSLRRRQDGLYVQGVCQLDRWRLAARYDMLELFADTFKQADAKLDLGEAPWRASASIEFNPSEFTRIRLQYNHDRSGRDGRSNDEGILQFIFGIGAHASHTF